MNLKKIIPLVACTAFLASCNYNNTLWNQTFTYQNDIVFDIDYKRSDGDKSIAEYIEEQMNKKNINWENSGTLSDTGKIVQFPKHSTISEIKSSTKELAKPTFDSVYKDFKLVISNKDTKTVKITYGGQPEKTLTAKLSDSETSPDNPTTIYFMDNTENVGEVSSGTTVGSKWNNGKVNCVEVVYGGYKSKTGFWVDLIEPIEISGQSYQKIGWDVYAKIAN